MMAPFLEYLSPRIPLLSLVLLIGCTDSYAPEPAVLPILGGIELEHENNTGWTFTGDGRTVFWSAWNGRWGSPPVSPRTIYRSVWQGDRWSKPEATSFSGGFNDDDPFVSPDGQWLYFVSDRPEAPTDAEKDTNIWRYHLTEGGPPQLFPHNSDAEEYSPVLTASGIIYFASSREGGFGQGDIYRATPSGDGFSQPELLGAAVNSSGGEWNVWVSADETEMLFEASGRSTNLSAAGDLYYSWRSTTGWQPAIAVTAINTRDSDLLPRLHPDGVTLLYTQAAIGAHAAMRQANWPQLRAGFVRVASP